MSKKTKNRVDPVEVFCRLRPLSDLGNEESCVKIIDESNLMLQMPECSASYRSGQIKQLVYSFSQIFDESTNQKQIYERVALPLIQDLLNGKNGLLFTYGVTGSGKTYSMIGNQSELGILQRSLDTLFNSISFHQAKKYIFKPDKMNSYEVQTEYDASIERQQNQNKKETSHSAMKRLSNSGKLLVNINEDNIYAVFISCVEIYNNYIYDLLDDTSNYQTDLQRRFDSLTKESKCLKEDNRACMYIKDVTEIEVKSTEEALDLMSKAQKKRVVACTELNAESSRSHSIFTIRVVQVDNNLLSESATNRSRLNNSLVISQLCLVDLAGSERTKRTKNTGSRLKEAGSINSSLMALRNCLETLRENINNGTRKMVPYRDSKLTLLFKNYFEGNGKIKMILCLNPNAIEFDETINVLKFSDLVRDILLPAVVPNNPITQQQQQQQQQSSTKTSSSSSSTTPKQSLDTFTQANLGLLANLQQNNYSLMNEPFPPMEIFSPDDDVTIRNIIDYLEEFQRRREAIIHETDLLKQTFYRQLRDTSDEFNKLRDECNDFKYKLELKEKEQNKSESKIKALEKIINVNCRTPLTSTLVNKSQTPTLFTNSNGNSAVHNEKSSSATATTTITSSAGSSTSGIQSETPSTYRTTNRIGSSSSHRLMMQAGAQLPPIPNSQQTAQQQTPSSAISSTLACIGSNKYQSPISNSSESYVQEQVRLRNGVPVANKRNRRSRSAEVWLDHKPPNAAKIETVLQPKMRRKKSVSKLELNDAKKSSKYVLTHQQQDENGEVVTNLIKGNILKSPTGGANVIFTDVETLKVKTQDLAKSSRPYQVKIEPSEDRAVIEERCSIAIEGHPLSRVSRAYR